MLGAGADDETCKLPFAMVLLWFCHMRAGADMGEGLVELRLTGLSRAGPDEPAGASAEGPSGGCCQ